MIRPPRRQTRVSPASLLALSALTLLFAACGAAEEARGWAPPVDAGDTVLIQDERGTLTALRIEGDGATPAWSYPTDDDEVDLTSVYAAPLVDNGVVYLASYSGLVVALNASTGRPVDTWSGPVNVEDRILATPVLLNERLTVVTEDGHVRNIDAATGTLSPVLDELGERVWGSPAAAGGALYVGSLSREVFALEPASGERQWSVDLAGAVAGGVVADGDLLLVGTFDRKLQALNASDGSERWAFEGTSWFWARPLVDGGSIYAASVAGQIVALDAATGDSRWETSFDLGQVRAAPALIANTLVIATRDGYLLGLDPASGGERWRQQLPDTTLLANPLVRDEALLYLTDEGALIRVDPATGQFLQLYARG